VTPLSAWLIVQTGDTQLDLSWSLSGMSVSGSVGNSQSPNRTGRRREPAHAADALPGLQVVGKQLAIPKLDLPDSNHMEPMSYAPLSPSAAVAQQLQQISESYRVGLISPEERGLLKNNVILSGLDRRVSVLAGPVVASRGRVCARVEYHHIAFLSFVRCVTAVCRSFGPIEKYFMFSMTSACARRTGAAARVKRRRRER
jgi:hypothetical protein